MLSGRLIGCVLMLSMSVVLGGGIEDYLDNHCSKCHDADSEKGGFSIEPVFETQSRSQRTSFLEKVLRMVEHGEMPPKKDPAFFNSADTLAFKSAAGAEVLTDYSAKAKEGLGGLRRLKSNEYANTMEGLLQYPLRDLERIVPADSPGSLAASEITDYHLIRYGMAADKALNYVLNRKQGKSEKLTLTAENAAKLHHVIRNQKAPVNPKKGVLLVGSRAGQFSSSAETSTRKIRYPGKYRMKVRVRAHVEPTDFRLAARHTHPNNQIAGILGSRTLRKGHATTNKTTEVKIEAYFAAGELPAVQKTSVTKGPGNYKNYPRETMAEIGRAHV